MINTPPEHKKIKSLYALAFGLVVAVILAEIISQIFIFYTTEIAFHNIPVQNNENLSDTDNIRARFLIHPYFGYIRHPDESVANLVLRNKRLQYMTSKSHPDWLDIKPNNHGFWSDTDYPISRNPKKDFIVGIFGGSVGQWMSVQAGAQLKHHLSELPALRGKSIHILNFANGGFKQPQQTIILAYFLSLGQKFDLILNIDGFNEAARPKMKYIESTSHFSFPHSYPKKLSALTSISDESTITWIHHGLELRANHQYWDHFTIQRTSALLYIFASSIRDLYQKNLTEHLEKTPAVTTKERSVFFTLQQSNASVNAEQISKKISNHWATSSILMHSMAASASAGYLHVLQPNQHYSKKQFSNAERKIAFNRAKTNSETIAARYPLFIKASHRISLAGINFVDATDVFDSTKEIVFSDSCCHYNDRGYQILINRLLPEIARIVDQQNKPPSL